MTIAVSSVVKPSKLLIAAVSLMCFATAAVIGMTVLAWLGEPVFLTKAGAVASVALLAFLGVFQVKRKEKIWRIDISGTGQIRVAECRVPDISPKPSSSHPPAPEVAQLLKDSTLWPNLLLLRLKSPDGTIIVMPILPDSVPANDFRALSAALRWIALHRQDERSKIL